MSFEDNKLVGLSELTEYDKQRQAHLPTELNDLDDKIVCTFDITTANTAITFRPTATSDDLRINWGDGTINNSLSHTYTAIGEYICVIDSDTTIPMNMFSNIYQLTSVKIPDKITSIDRNSFYKCQKLKYVTIGEGVTNISTNAFASEGGNVDKQYIIKAKKPPTLGTVTANIYVDRIEVPIKSVEAYKTATNWSAFADKIVGIVDTNYLEDELDKFNNKIEDSKIDVKIDGKSVVSNGVAYIYSAAEISPLSEGFVTAPVVAAELNKKVSKEELETRITAIGGIKTVQVVDELPTTNISETTLYLLRQPDGTCIEYVWVGSKWEQTGSTQIKIDSELSDTSENPVQNKVITREMQGIKGAQLQLGETSNTAYAGDKGAILAQVLGISFGGQKNLFDKNTVELTDGLIMHHNVVVAQQGVSHFTFPVEVGKTYTFPIYYRFIGYNAAYNVPCYNSAGEFIGRITGTPTADNAYLTFTNTDTVYSEEIWGNVPNAGVAYIKLNVGTGAGVSPNLDTFMIVEGDTYPSNYIPYGSEYTNNNSFENNPLTNKKIVFIGDSICAGTTDETGVSGWAQRIGEKNKMNWRNLGRNGATITEGISGVNMYIVNADFGENPDYIILEGGTNDADLIGTAEDFTPEKYGNYNMFDFTGQFDKTTFCGAVEHLFKRLTTDYVGAKIGFIIAHKMGFINSATDYTAEKSRRRFYFETIIKLCEKWGIPYIDLWNGCYLNPMNPAHNTANTNLMYVGDYQHLASKGYDYITPIIEAWIKTL